MANQGRTPNNRNGHNRDAGYGTSSSPRRPAQNSRRRTSGGQRNSRGRRRVRQPFYTKLSFWIAACALIIVIVLIAKGCDTGNIDAGKLPSDESLAPSLDPSSQVHSSETPSQSPSGVANPGTPTPASQPTTPTPEPSAPPAQTTPDVKPTTPNTSYFEEHELNAGIYLIGTDIPAGTADLTAMSGTGSVSTSNGSFNNPTFGSADSYTKYSEKIVLSGGTNLSVTGSLILRISYLTKPEIGITQTTTPGGKSYTLAPGTYTAGDNFESGTYDFTIVSGYGTVTSSNAETGGGIDEMMGVADSGGNYAQKVSGISLPAGTVVTVIGCTVTIS